MPNINLLDGKDFSPEVEKVDSTALAYDKPKVEVEEKQSEFSKPMAEAPVPEPEEQGTYEGGHVHPIEEPSPRFAQRSSNWPVIASIGGVLIVILILLYLFWGDHGQKEITNMPGTTITDSTQITEPPAGEGQSAETSQRPAERQPAEQQPGQATSSKPEAGRQPSTQPVATASLMAARRTGAVGAALFGDLVNAFPSGMRLSFFRYGNGTYSAEVMANSADIFNRFQQNLQNQNRQLKSELVSDREMYLDNQVVKVWQISGVFPASGSAPGGSKRLSFDNIRNEIIAAAGKANLQIKQVEISPSVALQEETVRPATVKATGEQTGISEFIQELLQYRNVGIDKLMVSSPSQQGSTTQLMTILDLDIYR